jgi:hypothetical protein
VRARGSGEKDPRLCAIICTCLALLLSVSPRLRGEIWVSLFDYPITQLPDRKAPTPAIRRTPSQPSQIGVDFSDFRPITGSMISAIRVDQCWALGAG